MMRDRGGGKEAEVRGKGPKEEERKSGKSPARRIRGRCYGKKNRGRRKKRDKGRGKRESGDSRKTCVGPREGIWEIDVLMGGEERTARKISELEQHENLRHEREGLFEPS